jgi:hypothetical protein
MAIYLENNSSVILWRNLWSIGRKGRNERHGTSVQNERHGGRLCKINGEGAWVGGRNVETGAALIVFDLWEQSVACLALGVCPKEKCRWRYSLLGRDNVRLGSIPASVSSRLHVAIFQKTIVRGPPPWGTSYRASLFLKLSLLPVALYRVVILSQLHRISLPDVILHTYGAGDSTVVEGAVFRPRWRPAVMLTS